MGYAMSGIVRIIPIVCSLLFCLYPFQPYAAEILELTTDADTFKEYYDSAANVSGDTIVGIRIGELKGKFNNDAIHIFISNANDVCVRSTTRDGRFNSSNIYHTKTPHNGADDRAVLRPITMNYKNELARYSLDDLAISAFQPLDGKCKPSSSIYLPQMSPSVEHTASLTVLINSGGRDSHIRMADGDTRFICKRIKGARVAYDQYCVIPEDKLHAGSNMYTLVMEDGFDEEPVPFKVLIP